jgi:hypothetical protein
MIESYYAGSVSVIEPAVGRLNINRMSHTMLLLHNRTTHSTPSVDPHLDHVPFYYGYDHISISLGVFPCSSSIATSGNDLRYVINDEESYSRLHG